jgi:hypothetical protein
VTRIERPKVEAGAAKAPHIVEAAPREFGRSPTRAGTWRIGCPF